ncbi:MAG: DNA gyrase subunit A [Burkholderiaceae bacterium]|nr:DNA gyrase subunit A [Burkholderiaceae bacterium]
MEQINNENQFAQETLPVSLEEEMRKSYLDYAMSVIMGRALPDVRDGLKPVHRRVLFAMNELGNHFNRPYKKSARVVGDVIGKYHPHGDSAAYETIVRMAQPFSMRYCLVDGQGNFGSVDGDGAAAMRYTEVRLKKIASEMLADIDKDTVDFGPNYDGNEQEPLVLPTRLPCLLVNGSSGIAVGMATNIPPHNLVESVNACLMVLDRPDCSIEEIMTVLPAPDFPTGGIIYGLDGVREAYRTGRGRVVMRAKTHVEEFDHGNREMIVIDEIPYQVNKRILLEKIAKLAAEKQIEGISFVRDESDKKGMRGVIELKKGANADVVLNNLYKNTQLEDSFGMNMVALVNGQPKTLNIKDIIVEFLNHRREVVTRRCQFELRQAQARAYLVEGQAVALANIDEFIEIIKSSANAQEAERRLLARTWDAPLVNQLLIRSQLDAKLLRPEDADMSAGIQLDGRYQLTDVQTKNILQMRLQSLTGLEQTKIENEYTTLAEQIKDLLDILAKPVRVTQIIADDLRNLVENYGDGRMTQIVASAKDVKTKDLIPLREMVVTLTDTGYIKSQASIEYRAQKRGGQGKKATQMKDGDIIDQLFVATTHDVLLCFTNQGRMYWLNVWDIPEGSSASKGRPIVNLLQLTENEKISVVLPISDEDYEKDLYIFMATTAGVVKKTAIADFKNQRKAGIIAVNLNEGDSLIGAEVTDGHHDVMLFSDEGKAVRFGEEEVRAMGRNATGVRGMKLEGDAKVIAMLVAQDENQTVLTATENGFGKRTLLSEFTRHGRGTKGMLAIQTSERNGKAVGAILVDETDEIILLTSLGKLVRTRVSEIRVMGRNTQGVTLITMDEGVSLVGLQRVHDSDNETDLEQEDENTEVTEEVTAVQQAENEAETSTESES